MCENENNIFAERVDNEITEILRESNCPLNNNDIEINVVSTVTVPRERYEELVKREAYLFSILRLIAVKKPYDADTYLAVVDDSCKSAADLKPLPTVMIVKEGEKAYE